MIRSSTHSIKFLNKNKKEQYLDFIEEYRRVAIIIGNDIWNNGYDGFKIKTNNLNFPKYVDYNKFNIDTWLSARARCSLTNQLSGMIRCAVETQNKKLFIINKLKEENKPFDHLVETLKKITKPNFEHINPELSSKNINIRLGNHFEWFISLSSIGKKSINIPIKKTKLDNKWLKRGKLLGGFSLSNNGITFRYEVEPLENKSNEIIGIDQGLSDVLTLSNGHSTPKKDIHNHSLHTILDKLSRCKKGSKGFKRAQEHRKNFINWSINQMNLSNYKEIRFEKIINIGFGKSKSRKMSHWTNTLIRDKVKRVCEETKVLFTEQSSIYRSQRCSCCGIVKKSNRKGKLYKCNTCGLEIDSDLNASKNHLADLPNIPFGFLSLKKNLKGFYWKPEGLFSLENEEIRVPHIKKDNFI